MLLQIVASYLVISGGVVIIALSIKGMEWLDRILA